MNINKSAVITCLLFTGVLHAQQIRFGVRGGLTMNSPAVAQTDESKRYLVGPVLELRWDRFSVEANLLYRRIGSGYSTPSQQAGGVGAIVSVVGPAGPVNIEGEWPGTSVRTRSNVWELPVVGKYYLRRRAGWQPFVGTGYSFMKAWSVSEGTMPRVEGNKAVSESFRHEFRSELNIGVIAAAGVQFRQGRMAVAPEVRYTRWSGFLAPGYRRNQVEVSVGITW